ncbi:MAG: HD-GYP domain-containing protein [Bacillota bacterium]|nr:HD-GYP domain-containing protein [Bacillota bacterium]
MRKVQVDKAQPGSILAKSIFTADGRELLSAGIEVRPAFFKKLKEHGINEIYIEDDISNNIQISDVVKDQTRQEAKELVKNIMNNYTLASSFNSERVKGIIDNILKELLESDEIIINLSDIKSVDDYTFEHSVNVCMLSLITGIGLGFDLPKLKDLGVGAILHDIGKLRIPEEILKKPSQLTVDEFEEIKKHTVYGYEILKNNHKVSMMSAFIAFGHHERYDGSGYPLQIKGDSIHQCARIVAIADVYDALTSDRVYRKKLRPHEVVEYITSLGSNHFDQKIVESFIKYIAIYPKGTGVLLNTKEKALVVKNNKKIPTRPVVRVVYTPTGEKISEPYDVDLASQNSIYILDACEL